MCTVSMITGHYQGLFPQPATFPPYLYQDYQELLRKARLEPLVRPLLDCLPTSDSLWMVARKPA